MKSMLEVSIFKNHPEVRMSDDIYFSKSLRSKFIDGCLNSDEDTIKSLANKDIKLLYRQRNDKNQRSIH